MKDVLTKGIPVRAPVVGSRDKPGGNCPAATTTLANPVPPLGVAALE